MKFMPVNCISMSFLLLFTSALCASNPQTIKPQRLDYVSNPMQKSQRIYPLNDCNPCWGDPVQYVPFNQEIDAFTAVRYDGVYVTVILPQDHLYESDATMARIRYLVDRLDLLYLSYKELLLWEPEQNADPLGKQVFAIMPEDVWFYGLAFVPGDSSEYSNVVITESSLDDGHLGNVWNHELAHNFDPVHWWDYGPDPAHDWTTILQIWFARHQALWHEANRRDFEEVEQQWYDSFVFNYLSDPQATWETCIANRESFCSEQQYLYLAGGIITYAASFIPHTATRDWLRTAWQMQQQGLALNDAASKADYALALLGDVSGYDVSCLAETSKWEIGPEIQRNASTNSTPFPLCIDQDNDGYTAEHDCNDNNAHISPENAEIAGDDTDNNCNGLIDELIVDEGTTDFPDDLYPNNITTLPLPLAIHAHLSVRDDSEEDSDTILFSDDYPALDVEMCMEESSHPELRMWSRDINSIWYGTVLTTGNASCNSTILRNNLWNGLHVYSDDHIISDVPYTLRVKAAQEKWKHRPINTLNRMPNNTIRASGRLEAIEKYGSENLRLRWWQSGKGVIQDIPASNPQAWRSPALSAVEWPETERPIQLMAQLRKDEMPLGEPSPPYYLPDSRFRDTLPPAAGHAGSWTSDTHAGEGFAIEFLSEQRAVVYGFTYDPDEFGTTHRPRRQSWFMADMQVSDRAMHGSLIRYYNGKFGQQTNPDTVYDNQDGWMEISFIDDNTGVVHLHLDGRNVEYRISRLTRVTDHADASQISGAWFDPALGPQGIVVQEFSPGQYFILMFTYTDSGNWLWYALNARRDDEDAIIFDEPPRRTEGGLFGRGYKPDEVEYISGAEVELSLNCTNGVLRFKDETFAPEWQEFQLQRLTVPTQVRCE